MTHYRLRIENMHMDAWETERSVSYRSESLQLSPEGWRWKTLGGDRKSFLGLCVFCMWRWSVSHEQRKKQASQCDLTCSVHVCFLLNRLWYSVSVQQVKYFTLFKGNCKVLCWFTDRIFPFSPHLHKNHFSRPPLKDSASVVCEGESFRDLVNLVSCC